MPSNPSSLSNLFLRVRARGSARGDRARNSFPSDFHFKLDMLDELDGANKSVAFPRPTYVLRLDEVGREVEA